MIQVCGHYFCIDSLNSFHVIIPAWSWVLKVKTVFNPKRLLKFLVTWKTISVVAFLQDGYGNWIQNEVSLKSAILVKEVGNLILLIFWCKINWVRSCFHIDDTYFYWDSPLVNRQPFTLRWYKRISIHGKDVH